MARHSSRTAEDQNFNGKLFDKRFNPLDDEERKQTSLNHQILFLKAKTESALAAALADSWKVTVRHLHQKDDCLFLSMQLLFTFFYLNTNKIGQVLLSLRKKYPPPT